MSLYTKDLASQMTKREYYANEVYAQITRFIVRGELTLEMGAEMAVRHADSLIAELEKK